MNEESGKPSVHAVLINYNDELYIESCLRSLFAQTYDNVRIHIIDNNSTDGSLDLIRRYPDIDLMVLDDNIGWGAASNIGIKRSTEQGADYILLLNTDTYCLPDMIEVLVRNAGSGIILSPKIYRGFTRDLEETDISGFETWYEGGRITDYAAVDQFCCRNAAEISDVDFISGCCMFMDKEAIRKIGYFDERFFLYSEDVDFCIRAKKSGISMKYLPSAVLLHYVGGSQGGEISAISTYYALRNNLFISQMHEGFRPAGDIIRNYMTGISEKAHDKYAEYIAEALYDFYRGNTGRKKFEAEAPVCSKADELSISYRNGFDSQKTVTVSNHFVECSGQEAALSITNTSERDIVIRATYGIVTNEDGPRIISVFCDDRLIDTVYANNFSGFKLLIHGGEKKNIFLHSEKQRSYTLLNLTITKTQSPQQEVAAEDVIYLYEAYFSREIESETALNEKLKTQNYGELVKIISGSEEYSNLMKSRSLQSVIL